jgi:uncharacterized membrane protein
MHTLIVYIHLIAACVAVGILLRADLALSKTHGRRLSLGAVKELRDTANIIGTALIALWASGLLLVIVGRYSDPNYLMNQKLWAKIAVVVVLTLNGAVLHHFSFPRVASSSGIVGLKPLEQVIVVSTGATSTVSWLFACYLGVARPWNHSMPFDSALFVYLALLLPACALGCAYVLGLSRSAEARSGNPPAAQRDALRPNGLIEAPMSHSRLAWNRSNREAVPAANSSGLGTKSEKIVQDRHT